MRPQKASLWQQFSAEFCQFTPRLDPKVGLRQGLIALTISSILKGLGMFRIPALIFGLMSASAAAADVSVQFLEGAPKDRFRIMNLSLCDTGPIDVTIDLSGSAAGLIFDTTAQGGGVQVFQPFELVEGGEQVAGFSAVSDGQVEIVLSLSDLPGLGAVAFTIDVDDTLAASSNGQSRVSDSEIAGATIRISRAAGTLEAKFDGSAQAAVALQNCTS